MRVGIRPLRTAKVVSQRRGVIKGNRGPPSSRGRRANFRQNQSTLRERSVILCEEGLVTLPQWLNTAFHPRQTRGQDLSSCSCAQAAMALDGGYRGFVKRGNCFEEINDRAGVKI